MLSTNLIHDPLFYYPKPYKYKPVLKDVLKNVHYSIGAKYPKDKEKVLALVPAGGCWRDLPDNIAREYIGKITTMEMVKLVLLEDLVGKNLV